MKSTMNISLSALKQAVEIKERISALEGRLNKILGGGDLPKPFSEPAKQGPRKMSASARAKIAAAQRARWAKLKGTSSSVVKPVKRKGGITAEGRARLAAAMKARWAARKKGAPALNARKKK